MVWKKRRKAPVVWLPLLGQGAGSANSWIQDGITVTAAGSITTNIYSILPDYPSESLVAAGQLQSLSDFEGSGYRLRRIVGKFNVGMDPAVGTDQNAYPEAALVGCGFIVLRVDEFNGAPLAAATPIQYSPLGLDNTRDPWIWRRTWLLSDPFAASPATTAMGLFPQANSEFGSQMDGPHIDARTARRISNEERLFMVVSTVYPGGGITPANNGGVRFVSEIRLIATPMRVMGNRRNASR